MNAPAGFEIRCPQCATRLRVPAPGRFQCPRCAHVFAAEASPAAETFPPEPSPATPQDTPAAPTPEPAPTSPSPADAPATCGNHPDRMATAVCQSCGKLVCPSCHRYDAGRVVCPECSATLVARRRARAGAEPLAAGAGVAWETERERGFFRGFGQAIMDSLFRPAQFFSAMNPRGDLWRAFLFGMIVQSAALIIQVLVMAANLRAFDPRGFLERFGAEVPPQALEFVDSLFEGLTGPFLVGSIIAAPLTAAANILVGALVVHLFLLLFGAARNRLEATLKVVSYSTAAQLITILPMCGGLIGTIWQLVILVIGLARAHETTTGRTLAAVLAPVVLVMLLVFLLIALVAGAIFAAIGR